MNREIAQRILGVSDINDANEVKRAYRNLLKLYHPDISGPQKSHEKTVEIINAFQVLTNPNFSESLEQVNIVVEPFSDYIAFKYTTVSEIKKKYDELKELWAKQRANISFHNTFALMNAALKLHKADMIKDLLTKIELINSCFLVEIYLPKAEIFDFFKRWDSELIRLKEYRCSIDLFFSKLKCEYYSKHFPYIGNLIKSFCAIEKQDLGIEFIETLLRLNDSGQISPVFEMLDSTKAFIICSEKRIQLEAALLELYHLKIRELSKANKKTLALDYAKKAVSIANTQENHKTLIKLLFELSKMTEAKEALNKANKKFGYIIGLDKIYKALNNSGSKNNDSLNQALIDKLIKRVNEPYPEIEVFVRLCKMLLKLGQAQDAEEYARKAFLINPHNKKLKELIIKHQFSMPELHPKKMPETYEIIISFLQNNCYWIDIDFYIGNVSLVDQGLQSSAIGLLFKIFAITKPDEAFEFLARNLKAENTVSSVKSDLIEALTLLDNNKVLDLLESNSTLSSINKLYLSRNLQEATLYFKEKQSRRKSYSAKLFSAKKNAEKIAILEKIIFSTCGNGSIEELLSLSAKHTKTVKSNAGKSLVLSKSASSKKFLDMSIDEIVFDYLRRVHTGFFCSFLVINKFLKAFPRPSDVFDLSVNQMFIDIFSHYLSFYYNYSMVFQADFFPQFEAFLFSVKRILTESDNVELISLCLCELGKVLSCTGEMGQGDWFFNCVKEINPTSYHIKNHYGLLQNSGNFSSNECVSLVNKNVSWFLDFVDELKPSVEKIKNEIFGLQLKSKVPEFF